MITLIKTSILIQATYTVFCVETDANLFTELLYKVFGVSCFDGSLYYDFKPEKYKDSPIVNTINNYTVNY